MKSKMKLFSALAISALILAACGGDDAEDTTTTAVTETTIADQTETTMADDMEDMGTIVDVAAGSEDFTTLVAALEAAGLVETLNGDGPFTVLAPTNEAFEAALAALELTVEELLADTETLTAILTYHVLPLAAPAATVVTLDGQEVETVNGATILVTVDGDSVMVNDANVVQTDILASNGVIHVIDAVLLPPSN
jgi:uncharacterized surface protein with fasciclin (FAS1) repeats